MKKPNKLVVSENTAKAFRLWEELGGPKYCSMDDAVQMFNEQLTDVEKREMPTWPKKDDEKVGVYYQLPKRLRPGKQF